MHWMSLATSIRKQQAVFTSTWQESKQSAINTSALFSRDGERKGLTKPPLVYRTLLTASCFFVVKPNPGLFQATYRSC